MFIHEAIYADDGIGAPGVLGFGDGTTAHYCNELRCSCPTYSRSGHSHSHSHDAQCWRCAAECCSWGS
jgi:broad specificity polyphosphatase/5'/3'-nucleotidase SurE